ncbi:uncharacterized protein LOC106163793 [Lingula anatina]|uniref:Uncharacterized protein LOC106163793 n=1 Tax=Lingula anatina TaxID=7574 RepID=A0A1S3IHG5_LINAN|nr:uncharacterized protein LOC106163793 [Lingula anatina]|eukprot:XP_013396929.1 uncharacterized protein LOC106163793 [Lingula anatina]
MDQGRHGVALFGLGRIGVEHFKNMLSHPGLSLLWVIEQDIQRAKDILIKFQQCNSTKITTPAEDAQVFADERVHGIVVCTPSFTHVDIILKAVKAGKAIFCEKPVSPTLEGVMQVYTEAQKQKIPLFCGFNRRFDQQIRKIHDYAQDGRVGKIHVIKMCSRDPAGKTATPEYYKNYGGFPNDSAVHDIDVVCWLMKERPISVYAVGHAHTSDYVAMGDVDTLVIVLNFPSGAKGIIDMSRNSPYGFDQRIEG